MTFWWLKFLLQKFQGMDGSQIMYRTEDHAQTFRLNAGEDLDTDFSFPRKGLVQLRLETFGVGVVLDFFVLNEVPLFNDGLLHSVPAKGAYFIEACVNPVSR